MQPFSIRQCPLIYMVVTLALAILLYQWVGEGHILALYGGLLICLLLVVTMRSWINHGVRSFMLLIGMLLINYYYIGQRAVDVNLYQLPYAIQTQYHTYTAEVTHSTASEKYHNLSVLLKSIQSAEEKINLPSQKVLLKIKRPNHINIENGSTIRFNGRLMDLESSSSTNDYYQYLSQSGYMYASYPKQETIRIVSPNNYVFWKKIRYGVRNYALHNLSQTIDNDQHAAVLKALLLGYKSDLSQDTRAVFVDSGTMHILAVSGLHVGIVASILYGMFWLLGFLVKVNKTMKLLALSILLIFFAEISGGAAPVWRAVMMTVAYLTARTYSLPSFSLNLLCFVAILLLYWEPLQLFQLSFQLSFIAVAGIIVIFPLLKSYFYPRSWWGRRTTDIVYMGISAQLAIAPLSLFYFQQISWLSPLTCTLAIPVAYLLIGFGMILIFFGGFQYAIIDYVSVALNMLMDFFLNTIVYASQIEIGLVAIAHFNSWMVVLFTFMIAYGVFFLRARQISQDL